MKKLILLLTALLLCVLPLLSGLCEAVDATPAPAEEPAGEEVVVTVTADPNEVVMTVNGSPVTRGTLDNYYQNVYSYYSSYGYDVSGEETINFLKAVAMNSAISYELMNQKAVELGITLSDDEIAAITATATEEWDQTVDMFIEYYVGLPEDATDADKEAARGDAAQMLESMGYTLDSMIAEAVQEAQYDKVQEAVTADVTVTDEEVQAAWDARVAEDEATYGQDVANYEMSTYYGMESLYTPEGYRGVLQILLEVDSTLLDEYTALSAAYEEQQAAGDDAAENTEAADADAAPAEPVTAEQVQAAYDAILDSVADKVDAINGRLANGEAFTDLIPEYNIDPGMEMEENLRDGYKVHRDSIIYDPAFVQAAFSVDEIGDVSAPYVGVYGVYMVMYLRDVPAGAAPATEEALAAVRTELLGERQSARFNEAMDQWVAESTIEVNEEFLPVWATLQGLLNQNAEE